MTIQSKSLIDFERIGHNLCQMWVKIVLPPRATGWEKRGKNIDFYLLSHASLDLNGSFGSG